ncbi:MAG: histidine phosphatase family protein, partial [Candidatus Aureabacteria bacterium]|nr:histidine phosphatase family protein [Candidatus Auribacterota bacterium]
MRIYLIRHGQTDWNAKEIFRGREDIPLDATGIQQAKATAERVSGCPIKVIYTSPLKRAMETSL